MGITTLELDVGITRDGVIVISHDQRLNPAIARDPSGQWVAKPGPLIHSLSYAEIARFDMGRIDPATEYGKKHAQQHGADGVRMPRLADLFALTERLAARDARIHNVRFNIETKINPEEPDATPGPEAFARALIALLRAHGLTQRATIQSFDWRTLAITQRDAPEIATVYLSVEQSWDDTIRRASGESPWTAPIAFRDYGSVPRMVRAAGGRIWSPYFDDLTPESRAEARALGMRVVVWTVNEPDDIERMLDWGVEGIISDYPDRVRAALTRRGLAVPPPLKP